MREMEATDQRPYRRAYLRLWREAEAIFLQRDPCHFVGGVCAAGLEDGCCLCDRHRPGEPCPVRSLGCKLHVCQQVEQQHPGLGRQLQAIGRKARTLGFSREIFSTMDDGRATGPSR